MYTICSGLFVVVIASCGGRSKLVVELGAAVEWTEEHSSGFDPEYSNYNGDATFMGARLPSPTVLVAYESVEVFVAGRRIWSLEERARAGLQLIDGVVVKAEVLLDRLSDLAHVEALGRKVTAEFDHWEERHSIYWPYVVRDFRACTESKTEKREAGRFVDASGIRALVVARCVVNPRGVSYGINIEFRSPDAPF